MKDPIIEELESDLLRTVNGMARTAYRAMVHASPGTMGKLATSIAVVEDNGDLDFAISPVELRQLPEGNVRLTSKIYKEVDIGVSGNIVNKGYLWEYAPRHVIVNSYMLGQRPGAWFDKKGLHLTRPGSVSAGGLLEIGKVAAMKDEYDYK